VRPLCLLIIGKPLVLVCSPVDFSMNSPLHPGKVEWMTLRTRYEFSGNCLHFVAEAATFRLFP
jgi:hypothetical protein